jgi:hypothetical protein
MLKRRRGESGHGERFPEALLAQARAYRDGWVYEIDHAYDPDGRVPMEGIKGAWRVGEDGLPTGEYWSNPDYKPLS